MFKKMLLAAVAVVALTTGAQADTMVRVGTVGPWGISLNKDKQTCSAFTRFNDTVLAIGHRENAGIWHAALFMPWANWFDDNQTVDVKVTFDSAAGSTPPSPWWKTRRSRTASACPSR